jgi:hypothetical protein
MSQIINITSEALQATIRRLLPSQQGFGEDLQASNVITPIIDLTPTAEGSVLPAYLQQASTLSNTAFNIRNATSTIISTPGFILVNYVSAINSSGSPKCTLQITDGLSTTVVFDHDFISATTGGDRNVSGSLVVFLDSGHSLTGTSNLNQGRIAGSVRQIATLTGELVDPPGFVSQ